MGKTSKKNRKDNQINARFEKLERCVHMQQKYIDKLTKRVNKIERDQQIVQQLNQKDESARYGKTPYRKIAEDNGCSTATVCRIAAQNNLNRYN